MPSSDPATVSGSAAGSRAGVAPPSRPGVHQTLELIFLLVRKELKVRYRNRFLGYLWALANPLAFAFVYWIAFKLIMRVDVENYSLYIICGIFPWMWMSTGVVNGTRSFFHNASLIKKARLPRAILPLSCVLQEAFHFIFALPVIIAFLYFAGDYRLVPAWSWQLPLMLVLQVAFTFPLALALALVSVYVRDIEYLVGIGFTLLFFATPMVYPITMVPEAWRPWFEWSPFNALMHSWRSAFMHGTLEAGSLAIAAIFALMAGFAAWLLYRALAPRIGELL